MALNSTHIIPQNNIGVFLFICSSMLDMLSSFGMKFIQSWISHMSLIK